ncbi:MAG: bifunctional phosphoribosyl-AMP cyclohydrolase/phosphoribosyl-ATP diphosphatase HisIE [Luteibaculaceae bacterium]
MEIEKINFDKLNGLIPAVIQDASTLEVLMLGFMNKEALQKTIDDKKVTFFSRTKNRLWTKGETSGNFLMLKSWQIDCDNDTLLCLVQPMGATCHLGTQTCFGEHSNTRFIYDLERIIEKRIEEGSPDSYTVKLLQRGINKVAQKVGEEAVELVIESKDDNSVLFLNEAADLMYHYILLLKAKGFSLQDVEHILAERHQKK